ncbi:MAG: LysM peptidoglycan-binding domain-containing protein [Polyangiaceae bacterium]|nr:LysM peptidoglycan-binding domain-containing protein [Polyangiaceae bacterium]
MKMHPSLALLTALATGVVAPAAWGQANDSLTINTSEGSVNTGSSSSGATGTTTTTTTTSTYVPPPGFPQPGVDINAGLPSSSRPRSGGEKDTFDLGRSSKGTVVRGASGATGILRTEAPSRTPELHVVKKGDTLWDLCAHYYNNPWSWPKVWSFNPQVQNPHWIYPGDQLRISDPTLALDTARFPSQLTRSIGGGSGNGSSRASLAPGRGSDSTVFLRDFSYIGDPSRDVWGEIIGAVEDALLLSQGNHVYVQVEAGKDVRVGDKFTVFREQHRAPDVPGARRPPGEVVAIQGTLVVDHFNPETRIARALIAESSDVIERGAKVTPNDQRLDKITKRPNSTDLWTQVVASPYPLVFLGQYQLVFLDKGSDDGLEAGNTVLIVRKGDTWRRSLSTTSRFGRARVKMTAPEPVVTEDTPTTGDESTFPAEAVAELRILRTEKQSSVAIVLETRQEIVAGDRGLVRKGY